LDGRAQIFSRGVQLAEEILKRVFLTGENRFDLRLLVGGQV
jgi:hypothetical protein